MNTDLTTGNTSRLLWAFSIPMLISVVFQQFYNIADSVIAGRFIGEQALAAVGASYPITMIFMAVAIGSSIGCTVVVSQLFGSRHYAMLKTAVGTICCAGVAVSLALSLFGIWQDDHLLLLLRTPENIFSDASLYLHIYILGFLFLFLYNVGTGIFTALGDSRTPLYFLIGSSLGNIALDLLFVIAFDMGVAGVAWATFLAQGIACVLALITLFFRLKKLQTTGPFRLFSFTVLGQVTKVAVPSILQQCFVSVGNLFIQGLVNSYGSAVIAGYSGAIKLNTFGVTCMTTLSNGLSSFTAQNLGAGKKDRVQEGFRAGAKMGILVSLPFVLVYFFFSEAAMGLFMKSESAEAIAAGAMFLKIVTPFYFVVSTKVMCDGVLRGGSAMLYFMTTTFTDLVLRVVLAFVFAIGLGLGSTGIWLSWPFGWSISCVLSYVFYRKKPWEKRSYDTL
ncbi:MATE family efflux transporter [Anaerotignum sp.]|uniref:MATE family efflux transporter n=1 Tax=Anaerotignum sp. TaxID=2039241 RepID=UPI002A909545|nr:MATE family efflux transporter [Anaerotignum sp.]MCI7656440.1 MATE family efflux transporter [Clostridia bacterium]MDY5416192.1 MATE family efflux transporter [Anaerotignum sp.]